MKNPGLGTNPSPIEFYPKKLSEHLGQKYILKQGLNDCSAELFASEFIILTLLVVLFEFTLLTNPAMIIHLVIDRRDKVRIDPA